MAKPAAERKAEKERLVFQEFIRASDLPIESESVESRPPPEPDILCTHAQEGKIAFELAELCSQGIAKAITKDLKTGECTYVRADNPSREILKEKLSNKYQSTFPMELLIYGGRTATPDEVVIEEMAPILDMSDGPFRRVWFLGDACRVVWTKP